MSVPEVDVVLLAPPYFRFCGSHNDRAAPTLTYLSRFLDDAGISYVSTTPTSPARNGSGACAGCSSTTSHSWMPSMAGGACMAKWPST